ncbi:MAG: bifunctional oligoribonuclease/PAP phosphatase NrnA [Chlorobi bacterium]|nr:bifunctional oligoribonuclease/PAP phosphatase NrnA [Chlorobiota bacterium]
MAVLDFSEIKPLLSTRKKILIVGHTNPDGDALGSSLALYNFLKAESFDLSVIVPTSYPGFLAWMPGQENIRVYEKEKGVCDRIFDEAEVIFSLDHNSPSRLGIATKAFGKSKALKIMIDHHIDPDKKSYDLVFSTTETTSTSELIYDFLAQYNQAQISREVAECIYVGIMTDTGSFSYACNYEKTYRTVADLFKLGIDGVNIHRRVYDTFSESRMRLLGYCLSEKMVVMQKLNTAYISLTKEELERFDFKPGDTEGVVNYSLAIKGIRLAALFTEKENKIRISFRSAGKFDVNVFANKHFEGGGHRNAAGGDSFLPMDKTLEKFERLLLDHKEELCS